MILGSSIHLRKCPNKKIIKDFFSSFRVQAYGLLFENLVNRDLNIYVNVIGEQDKNEI